MAIDIKKALKNERFKPVGTLSNYDFNNISGNSSIGHYQYHSIGGHFTFREQENILELKKITLEDFIEKLLEKSRHYLAAVKIEVVKKNDGKYNIAFFSEDGTEYSYLKSDTSLFLLLIAFYKYSKKTFYLNDS